MKLSTLQWISPTEVSAEHLDFIQRNWPLGGSTEYEAIAGTPGRTHYAVVSTADASTWDWSVFSATGMLLDEGWSQTADGAQNDAGVVLMALAA